jgi:hypothetical protein
VRRCAHELTVVASAAARADASGPGAPPIPAPRGEGDEALLSAVPGGEGGSSGGTRSACCVNGRPVPLRVLRALGAALVDVNGHGAAFRVAPRRGVESHVMELKQLHPLETTQRGRARRFSRCGVSAPHPDGKQQAGLALTTETVQLTLFSQASRRVLRQKLPIWSMKLSSLPNIVACTQK